MTRFYKFFLVGICTLLFAAPVWAQAPQGIAYQAIARNSGGAVIASQNIALRFSVRSATASGTIVYSETQTATTNALGLFSLFVGKGSPVSGSFSSIDWPAASKFLQVEMDAAGGSAFIDMGTQQMMSVPYALYADKAGNGLGMATKTQTLYFNGTKWDSTSNFTNDPAAGKINARGTFSITSDTSLTDSRYAFQIEMAKPVMLSRMTQAQIDALSPVEGMEVFNTTSHKKQVYAMLTNNADILNEIYTGTESGTFFGPRIQYFTPPISGRVVAIDILVKDAGPFFPYLDFTANSIAGSSFQTINFPNPLTSFTWVTILFNSPLTVMAGSQASFSFGGAGVNYKSFATNSFYPNGSGCCFNGADYLLFRIHIQPTAGTYGWQNLN
jgi:hypothetical protein